MSLAGIVIVLAAGVLLLALLVTAAALFSPIVFIFDSENWQVRVRWLAVLEYWRRLPGKDGAEGLSIARRPVRLPARSEIPSRAPEGAAPRPRKDRAKTARLERFAFGCLKQPAVRAALVRSVRQLWRGLTRSVALSRVQVAMSLPDPAWNGMLIGWLAASGLGVSGRSVPQVRVNFAGENVIVIEGRLYPYRVVKALAGLVAGLLVGLPYGTLLREWRASAA